jgi:hypothetical protein
MRICSKLLRLEKVHLQAQIVVLLILKLLIALFKGGRWCGGRYWVNFLFVLELKSF